MALKDPFAGSGLDNVLIIDPNSFSRRLASRLVAELGCHRVTAVDSVAEGLARLVCEPIEIVLVDREIGPSAIICLMRSLRQSTDPAYRYMPVVLSADTLDRDYVCEAHAAGVDGVVLKPCCAKVLGERLYAAAGAWYDVRFAETSIRTAYGATSDEDAKPARLFTLLQV